MYVRRRPTMSVTNPKLAYPNHIPTCIATTSPDIANGLNPIPPWSTDSERYAGTQALSPHHPNRAQAFIIVRAAVVGPSGFRNAAANVTGDDSATCDPFWPRPVLCFQISGSST